MAPFADGEDQTRKGPRNTRESLRYRKEGDRKRTECKPACEGP